MYRYYIIGLSFLENRAYIWELFWKEALIDIWTLPLSVRLVLNHKFGCCSIKFVHCVIWADHRQVVATANNNGSA